MEADMKDVHGSQQIHEAFALAQRKHRDVEVGSATDIELSRGPT